MKTLIINADDFGLLNCVNDGIADAYNNGILTSATLMINMSGAQDAINTAKKHGIPCGIHLNLNAGKPLAATNAANPETGEFYRDVYKLIAEIKKGFISIKDVEKELYAQLSALSDSGLKITHIDSHKHSHQYLPIFKTVENLAEKFNIKKIRMSADLNFMQDIEKNADFYSADFSYQSYIQHHLKTGTYKSEWFDDFNLFSGFFYAGKMNLDNFKKILYAMRNCEKPLELMFHPAYNRAELQGSSSLTHHRETELKTLVSPEAIEIIKKNNIKLIDFSSTPKQI
ncbi:MAG TPA: ChbG/HpnK family deacetylase [bacterium]|nr:ChbG/HpnK family deacetylase [bacterium]